MITIFILITCLLENVMNCYEKLSVDDSQRTYSSIGPL